MSSADETMFLNSEYSLIKWPITAEKIYEYRSLVPEEPHPFDCAINTLHFLGVIRDKARARELAIHENFKKTGLSVLEIIEHLYAYYSVKGENIFQDNFVCFKWSQSNLLLLVQSLGPGFSTIFNIVYNDNLGRTLGHTVVICVDFAENVFVFDPQKNILLTLDSLLSSFISLNANIYSFCLFFRKTTKKRFRNSQELRLRKKSSSSLKKTKKQKLEETSQKPVKKDKTAF